MPLPKLPHVENTTCPGPDFTVSPNGEWIVAVEKLYRGANEIWLLHKDAPLHYSLAFYPSFSRAAWKYYERATGKTFHLDSRYITRVGPWPTADSKLRLTLYGESSFQYGESVDMSLCLDLASKAFSISSDQKTVYY